MNSLELLQVSDNVLLKSAEMAEKDPHGSIITLVSIGVVFMALIILYFAYSMIGKIISGHINIPSIIRKKKLAALTVGQRLSSFWGSTVSLGTEL